MKSAWMALFQHVSGAGSTGPHFMPSCGSSILFGLILIHGNLEQETTGQLSEEYTSSCVVFNTPQGKIQTSRSESTNPVLFDKFVDVHGKRSSLDRKCPFLEPDRNMAKIEHIAPFGIFC